MEVKSGEGTVVVALVGGGFGAAAVSVWDKINDTAKDQEIARLNRVVDAQRDQNIINSVVQALGNKTA